ncbi:MAG: peptidylprolyl isomerase [Dysgonamonadaceae bacterium]|jgi:peptidyl-prolyl cis-trans isomerase B (cyclophilin B)|nr:peptidylprolyl isomerase [Dysgonamonadaceae bacterium]
MKIKIFFTLLFTVCMLNSCNANTQTYTIETTEGNIKVVLYEETPLHKANFEKLVDEKAYDGVLFHRIIENFMIQTGDLSTKPKAENDSLQSQPPTEEELIPAEFVSEYFHKKGALAAARMGDHVNPEKKSSPTQFYIVQGTTYSGNQLKDLEDGTGKYWNNEKKEVYKTIGGTPFLDKDYTVFGEVVEGLDIVDKIAATPTGPGDYPLNEVRIITITKD